MPVYKFFLLFVVVCNKSSIETNHCYILFPSKRALEKAEAFSEWRASEMERRANEEYRERRVRLPVGQTLYSKSNSPIS